MVRRIGAGLARVAAVGVLASIVLPLIPAWPFVLFEHFRFQYVWVGILVVAACAGLQLRDWFDAVLVATLVNALWIVPDLSRSTRPLPTGTPVRVLSLNVLTSSSAVGEVIDLVGDTNPDVIGLVEVNARWITALAPALTAYAYRIEHPRNDNFGVALYSKLPMTGSVEHLGSRLPTIVATVDIAGRQVGVLVTHPIPPVGGAELTDELAQLDAVAWRARAASPVIVMGDLNATPWSAPFRAFMATSRLCDSRAGFGLQASFPAESAIMRIPIDHVLVSCSIGVRSRAIERAVGSDHLPVLVDLVVPP